MNNRIYFRLKAGHILNFVMNNENVMLNICQNLPSNNIIYWWKTFSLNYFGN